MRSSNLPHRLLIAVALLNSGCATTRYLVQALSGQMEIQNRARPIDEVLRDEKTPPETKHALTRIADIKAYGESKGLKATSNYRDYVDLKRPAVVWSVSACEKLKFVAKEWHFPIVGSFTYLGWFAEDAAREHARTLAAEGWDVDVRPVSAFSTLGYFKDPVLSTMLARGPSGFGDLANVILHESVHATVYVNNQSSFNESLASFVADRLTPLYLGDKGAPGERSAYEQSERDGVRFVAKLRETYTKLDAVYQDAGKSDEQKLADKTAILAALKQDLGAKRDFTNASIIQFKTYDTGTEDFEAAFARCGNDFAAFLKNVGALKESDFGGPQATDLKPALARVCAKAA